MKITQSKLRRIIRKVLLEGAYEKLNSDATGDSRNLDQELHFGLTNEVEDICMRYQQDFAEYGVTEQDIFEELKIVVNGMSMKNIQKFSIEEDGPQIP